MRLNVLNSNAESAAVDWAHWLLLADRYSLRHTVRQAAPKVLQQLLMPHADKKALFTKLRGLSGSTAQLLFEATVKAASSLSYKAPYSALPTDFDSWTEPGDFF